MENWNREGETSTAGVVGVIAVSFFLGERSMKKTLSLLGLPLLLAGLVLATSSAEE